MNFGVGGSISKTVFGLSNRNESSKRTDRKAYIQEKARTVANQWKHTPSLLLDVAQVRKLYTQFKSDFKQDVSGSKSDNTERQQFMKALCLNLGVDETQLRNSALDHLPARSSEKASESIIQAFVAMMALIPNSGNSAASSSSSASMSATIQTPFLPQVTHVPVESSDSEFERLAFHAQQSLNPIETLQEGLLAIKTRNTGADMVDLLGKLGKSLTIPIKQIQAIQSDYTINVFSNTPEPLLSAVTSLWEQKKLAVSLLHAPSPAPSRKQANEQDAALILGYCQDIKSQLERKTAAQLPNFITNTAGSIMPDKQASFLNALSHTLLGEHYSESNHTNNFENKVREIVHKYLEIQANTKAAESDSDSDEGSAHSPMSAPKGYNPLDNLSTLESRRNKASDSNSIQAHRSGVGATEHFDSRSIDIKIKQWVHNALQSEAHYLTMQTELQTLVHHGVSIADVIESLGRTLGVERNAIEKLKGFTKILPFSQIIGNLWESKSASLMPADLLDSALNRFGMLDSEPVQARALPVQNDLSIRATIKLSDLIKDTPRELKSLKEPILTYFRSVAQNSSDYPILLRTLGKELGLDDAITENFVTHYSRGLYELPKVTEMLLARAQYTS